MRSLISCFSRPTTQGKPTKLGLLNSRVPKGVGYCLLDQKRGPKVTVSYYVPDFKHSIIHMSKPNIEAIVSATLPRCENKAMGHIPIGISSMGVKSLVVVPKIKMEWACLIMR
jgi:hypothetical protein